MARSVSVPYEARTVAYAAFEGEYEHDWLDAVEGFRSGMTKRYSSLKPCFKRVGHEDQAVLENDKVFIGVSEHNGLVSVWALPKDTDSDTDCEEAGKMNLDAVEAFGIRLRKLGTFSNSEAIFEAMKSEESKSPSGLGFTSKYGWL